MLTVICSESLYSQSCEPVDLLRRQITEVTAARERRAQGSRAVQSEVERIRTLSDRLEMLGLNRKVGEP